MSVRMMNSNFVRLIQHVVIGREAIENPTPGRFTGQDKGSEQSAKFASDRKHYTNTAGNSSQTISPSSFVGNGRPGEHTERDPNHSPHTKSVPPVLFECFVRIFRASNGLSFASISAHARDIFQPLPEMECHE